MYVKIDPSLQSQHHYVDYESSAYTMLFLLTSLAVATYAIARYAESQNQLNYESRFARIVAGLLLLITRTMHTQSGDLTINDAENKLFALGPHRTAWEAIVFASKIKGTPPQFFATDAYNCVPGVSSFLKMFKAIPVATNVIKGDNNQTANAGSLEKASQALNDKGCVALFPQGNFARLSKEPPRIYAGAARIAIKNNIPVHVIRLDGFWSLQNPLIPVFIRDNAYYRIFLSALHINNVRVKLVSIIDFHLKPENKELSENEKIEEICAQLYAFYRHTNELSEKQTDVIKTQITDKKHLLIWKNKVQQDDLEKQLLNLKKEVGILEQPTVLSFNSA